MKPINIVLIGRRPLGSDGVSRVIECWAGILGASGHSVTILSKASPNSKPVPKMYGVTGIQYHSPAGGPFVEARAAAALLAQLQQERDFDLVISHDSMIAVEVRRILPRIPLLGTFHSPLVEENRLRNWKYADRFSRRLKYPATWAALWLTDWRALRAVNHVHTLSTFTWRMLSARYPGLCRNASWSLIPGSFNQQHFGPPTDREVVRARLGISSKELLLFTVRRLVPRNGVDRIVSCATRLKGVVNNVRFVIGGTGPIQEYLTREIQEAGLADVVTLVGFIEEEKLPLYYQAADGFLMPSRELECFGLPVIEAMACGCLPLVMPEGGPAEVCACHPEWIAKANTDEAFFELVREFLLGQIPVPIGIEKEAFRHYSNEAIKSQVLELVQSLHGHVGVAH